MFLNTQRTLLRGRTLLALVAVGTAAVTLAALQQHRILRIRCCLRSGDGR